ncbi:SdpI family protein [Candidatus Kaiserbacteria bacterium]|nr:SdpI family protein [Candidatus Kaiserbacteria bacterium]
MSDPLRRLTRMTNRAAYGAVWLLALAAFLAGIYFFRDLPDPMVSHWNAVGTPDGYMGKLLGVSLMPAVILLSSFVFLAITRIDPLRRNIESFRGTYNTFVVLVGIVLAVIQAAVLAVNLGASFNIGVVIMPAVGALLFAVGVLLPSTKRNFFIGIRTPWTVSDDVVWERTHALGGFIFKVLGVVAIFSIIAPSYAVYLFLAPLFVAVVGLIIYSYVVYRELHGGA